MRNIWLGILVLFLVLGGLNIALWSDVNGETGELRPMYIPHAPCRINNNLEFATSLCRTAGNGTQGNPYLIEGWDINGTGYGYALYIGNTSSFFIVSNNHLHHVNGRGDFPFFPNAGLLLYKASNGQIRDNDISRGRYGIVITDDEIGWSRNIEMVNNSVSNNTEDGIAIYASGGYVIKNNTISNNSEDGISLAFSCSVTIIKNLFYNNGIDLGGNRIPNWNSHTITKDNLVNGKPIYYYKDQKGGMVPNDAGQVILANSTGMKIEHLNISNASIGVQLAYSSFNHITNNVIMNNSQEGISLEYSNDSYLLNNTLLNNGYGIEICYSQNDSIVNNSALRNGGGIYLFLSTNTTVSNNNFSNGVLGIDIVGSRSFITHNVAFNNKWYSLRLGSGSFNEITGNSFSNNNLNGIYIDGSSTYNNITNNKIDNNRKDGIFLEGSANNITYNMISNNSDFGINATYEKAWPNIIHHNKFIDNTGGQRQAWNKGSRNVWNDSFEGNYWNDFDTPAEGCNDVDSNGICDSPYLIPGINTTWDYYPLTDIAFPRPYVVRVTPIDGATNVALNTDISIQFNMAMNRTATEGSILASPLISGIFIWDKAQMNLTWNPNSDLQTNKKYTITVTTLAKSKSGLNMRNQYIFHFITSNTSDNYPPYLVYTSPSNGSTSVPTNTKIELIWNESMNRLSAQKAFSAMPSIQCLWSWSNLTQVCTLNLLLQPSTKYTIKITTIAEDLAGNTMRDSYIFSFTTGSEFDTIPPTVIVTNPSNGSQDIATTSSITITFSEAMNKNATESAISITPGMILKREWDGSGRNFTLLASLIEGQTYTMRISTEAKDLAGNTMVKAHTFSFTTRQEGISNMTISLSLLILVVIILLFIMLFLMRKRKKKLVTKEIKSEKDIVSPEHVGDAIQSPASAGARIEGAFTFGKPYNCLQLYGKRDQEPEDPCLALWSSLPRQGETRAGERITST